MCFHPKSIGGDVPLKKVLETTWNQARNETFKVHEMEQLH
jgi:hypothetical protein